MASPLYNALQNQQQAIGFSDTDFQKFNEALNSLSTQSNMSASEFKNVIQTINEMTTALARANEVVDAADLRQQILQTTLKRTGELLSNGKLAATSFSDGIKNTDFKAFTDQLDNLNKMVENSQKNMTELQNAFNDTKIGNTGLRTAIEDLQKINGISSQTVQAIDNVFKTLKDSEGKIGQTNFDDIAKQFKDLISALNKEPNAHSINSIVSIVDALKELQKQASDASASMAHFNDYTGSVVAAFGENVAQNTEKMSKNLKDIIGNIRDVQSAITDATKTQYEFKINATSEKFKSSVKEIESLIREASGARKGGKIENSAQLDRYQNDLIDILNGQIDDVKEFQKFIGDALTFNQIELASKASQEIIQTIEETYSKQVEAVKNAEGLDDAERNKLKELFESKQKEVQNIIYNDISQTADSYARVIRQALGENGGKQQTDITAANINGINVANIIYSGRHLQMQGAISGNSKLLNNGLNISSNAQNVASGIDKLNGYLATNDIRQIQEILFQGGQLKDKNVLSTLIGSTDAFVNDDIRRMSSYAGNNKEKQEQARTAQGLINTQRDLKASILTLVTAIQQRLEDENKTDEANALQGTIDELTESLERQRQQQDTLPVNIGNKIDKAIDVLKAIDKGIVSLPDNIRGDMFGWTGIGYMFNQNVRDMIADPTKAYDWAGVNGMNQTSITNNAKNYAAQEENDIYALERLRQTYGFNYDSNDIVKNQSNILHNISGGKIKFEDLAQSYQQTAQIGKLSSQELADISEYAVTLSTGRSDVSSQDVNSTISSLHRTIGLTGEESIQVMDRLTQTSNNSGISTSEYAKAVQNLSANLRYFETTGNDVSNMMDTFGNILSQTDVTMSELDNAAQNLMESFRYMGGDVADVTEALNNLAALHDATNIPMKDLQGAITGVSDAIRYMGGNADDVTNAVLKMGVASDKLGIPMKDLQGIFNNSSDSLRYLGASQDEAINTTIRLADMAKASGISIKDYQNAFSGVADQVRMMGGNTEDAVGMMGRLTSLASQGREPLDKYIQSYTQLSNTFRTMGMNGNDAMRVLSNMATLAIRTGTPIQDYMSIIQNLSTSYYDLGLSQQDAINVLTNLVNTGMTTRDASSVASAFGSALSKFSNDESSVIMSGILMGNGDIFGNLFNSQYVTGDNWGKSMAAQMDTMLNLNRSMFGNGALGDWQTLKKLQSMGFSQKQASLIFDEIEKGNISGLSDLLNNNPEYQTADDATITTSVNVADIDKNVEEIKKTITGENGEDKTVEEAKKAAKDQVTEQKNVVGTINQMNEDAKAAAKNLTGTIEHYAETLQKFQENNINTLADRIEANYKDMINYLEGPGNILQNDMDKIALLTSIWNTTEKILAVFGMNTLGSIVSRLPQGLGGSAANLGSYVANKAGTMIGNVPGVGSNLTLAKLIEGGGTVTGANIAGTAIVGGGIGLVGHGAGELARGAILSKGARDIADDGWESGFRTTTAAITGMLGMAAGGPVGAAIATAAHEAATTAADAATDAISQSLGYTDKEGNTIISGSKEEFNDSHFNVEKTFQENAALLNKLGIHKAEDLSTANLKLWSERDGLFGSKDTANINGTKIQISHNELNKLMDIQRDYTMAEAAKIRDDTGSTGKNRLSKAIDDNNLQAMIDNAASKQLDTEQLKTINADFYTMTTAINELRTTFKEETANWSDKQITAFGLYAGQFSEDLNKGNTTLAGLKEKYDSVAQKVADSDIDLSKIKDFTTAELHEHLKKTGFSEEEIKEITPYLTAQNSLDVVGTVEVTGLEKQIGAINEDSKALTQDFFNSYSKNMSATKAEAEAAGVWDKISFMLEDEKYLDEHGSFNKNMFNARASDSEKQAMADAMEIMAMKGSFKNLSLDDEQKEQAMERSDNIKYGRRSVEGGTSVAREKAQDEISKQINDNRTERAGVREEINNNLLTKEEQNYNNAINAVSDYTLTDVLRNYNDNVYDVDGTLIGTTPRQEQKAISLLDAINAGATLDENSKTLSWQSGDDTFSKFLSDEDEFNFVKSVYAANSAKSTIEKGKPEAKEEDKSEERKNAENHINTLDDNNKLLEDVSKFIQGDTDALKDHQEILNAFGDDIENNSVKMEILANVINTLAMNGIKVNNVNQITSAVQSIASGFTNVRSDSDNEKILNDLFKETDVAKIEDVLTSKGISYNQSTNITDKVFNSNSEFLGGIKELSSKYLGMDLSQYIKTNKAELTKELSNLLNTNGVGTKYFISGLKHSTDGEEVDPYTLELHQTGNKNDNGEDILKAIKKENGKIVGTFDYTLTSLYTLLINNRNDMADFAYKTLDGSTVNKFVESLQETPPPTTTPDTGDTGNTPDGSPNNPLSVVKVGDTTNTGYLGAGQLMLANDAAYGSSYLNGNASATTDWDAIKKSLNAVNGNLSIPYDSQGLSMGMRQQSAIAAYGGLPQAKGRGDTNIQFVIRDNKEKIWAEHVAEEVNKIDNNYTVEQVIIDDAVYRSS